ncbi:transmembrane protein, putative [Medicago truncatula]|uniref:Transmembrane protein, putative n=1 Tax=Medicago truncatula TaxID=3880 RepID=A0A072TU69_MEDTR|nr:transmembrane protein, putative [Medicago truncatula]
MQLKCNDMILHLIIAKIILRMQENFGRIDDLDLRLMWLIKNRTLVNWPLFFYNKMVSYKLDNIKRLPYPSLLGCVLSSNGVRSDDTLLTKPNPRNGLDIGVVNTMHYYLDGRSNWYYDNGNFWFYDDIVVPVGSSSEETWKKLKEIVTLTMTLRMLKLNKVLNLNGMSQVLASISDIRVFMTQRFNDQDEQFLEINHRGRSHLDMWFAYIAYAGYTYVAYAWFGLKLYLELISMAANSNLNIETSVEKEDDVMYDAEPISCILPNGLSDELINNWKIKEKPRTNGRIDRTYHHKMRKLTFRSMKAVERYEILGILPQRKRKT